MYASSDALWMVGVAFPLAASMAAPSTLMDARRVFFLAATLALALTLGLERQALGRRGRVRGGVGAVVRRANDERGGAVAARAEGGGATRERGDPARGGGRSRGSRRRADERASRARRRGRRADRDRRHLFLRLSGRSRRARAPCRRASASPARVARRCGRADNKRAIAAQRRLGVALADALRISSASESAQRLATSSRRNLTRPSWFGGLGSISPPSTRKSNGMFAFENCFRGELAPSPARGDREARARRSGAHTPRRARDPRANTRGAFASVVGAFGDRANRRRPRTSRVARSR